MVIHWLWHFLGLNIFAILHIHFGYSKKKNKKKLRFDLLHSQLTCVWFVLQKQIWLLLLYSVEQNIKCSSVHRSHFTGFDIKNLILAFDINFTWTCCSVCYFSPGPFSFGLCKFMKRIHNAQRFSLQRHFCVSLCCIICPGWIFVYAVPASVKSTSPSVWAQRNVVSTQEVFQWQLFQPSTYKLFSILISQAVLQAV